MIRNIVIGITLFCTLTLFLSTYYRVEQYERAVLTRWGQVVEVVGPGLSFKAPIMHKVHFQRIDMQTYSNAKQPANTYTIDNQEVDVIFTVFYTIPPEKVQFVYENAQNYESLLANIVWDRLKVEMGRVHASHVAENRGAIRDTIKATLVEDAKVIGINVVDFQLTNMEFHESFQKAVRAAATAKQVVEQKNHEKQQVMVDAEKAREQAKGEADAKLTVARADAASIQLKGEAEAKSIRAQAEALQQNQKLVELRKAERWDGVLPVWITGGSASSVVPFMNVEPPVRTKE
jgi:regulator of protease activity HflC (stomatin/prohibitin superfamily)